MTLHVAIYSFLLVFWKLFQSLDEGIMRLVEANATIYSRISAKSTTMGIRPSLRQIDTITSMLVNLATIVRAMYFLSLFASISYQIDIIRQRFLLPCKHKRSLSPLQTIPPLSKPLRTCCSSWGYSLTCLEVALPTWESFNFIESTNSFFAGRAKYSL